LRTLDRVQFLSRNYESLQGLRAAPLGVFAVVFGLNLLIADWPAPAPAIGMLLLFASLVAMPVAHLALRAYYRRTFGYAQPRPNTRDALYALLFVIGLALDGQFGLPVSLFALAAVVYLLDQWWRARDLRFHYALLALVMLGYALATALIPAGQRLAASAVAIGVVILLGGLLDHLLLLRLVGGRRPEAVDDQPL
jgi:hypothetical protein